MIQTSDSKSDSKSDPISVSSFKISSFKISFASADLAEAKKAVATNQENKAVAQGDLEVVTKALNADKGDLAGLHHDCMSRLGQLLVGCLRSSEERPTFDNRLGAIQGHSCGSSDP